MSELQFADEITTCHRCGAEAKFWYGPKWLCWEHYVAMTAVLRISH